MVALKSFVILSLAFFVLCTEARSRSKRSAMSPTLQEVEIAEEVNAINLAKFEVNAVSVLQGLTADVKDLRTRVTGVEELLNQILKAAKEEAEAENGGPEAVNDSDDSESDDSEEEKKRKRRSAKM